MRGGFFKRNIPYNKGRNALERSKTPVYAVKYLKHCSVGIRNGVISDIFAVQINLCADCRAFAVADNLFNKRLVAEARLKHLYGNVFAVIKQNQVFASSGDIEKAVIIKIPEIARMKKTVFVKDLFRCLFVFVITLHNIRPFDKDLAVFNFDLHARYRFSDRAVSVTLRSVVCNNRGAFSHSVTVEDKRSGAVEFVVERSLKRSAAGDYIYYVSAEEGADGLFLRKLRVGGSKLESAEHDFFNKLRNGKNAVRLIKLQIRNQICKAVVDADSLTFDYAFCDISCEAKAVVNGQAAKHSSRRAGNMNARCGIDIVFVC